MVGDAISPRQRLERLSANRWEHRLAMLLFAIAIILALMCENGNAAPQALPEGQREVLGATSGINQGTVGAAPFVLSNPMCQTGFTIAMRYDDRNSAGTIIKSVWVRKCVRVPRIVYGRKV